jgi:hypothetical protein
MSQLRILQVAIQLQLDNQADICLYTGGQDDST